MISRLFWRLIRKLANCGEPLGGFALQSTGKVACVCARQRACCRCELLHVACNSNCPHWEHLCVLIAGPILASALKLLCVNTYCNKRTAMKPFQELPTMTPPKLQNHTNKNEI
eukprot:2227116-Amphidinium_carterae.1